MTNLNVPDSPKMLRETLCVAQARVGNSPLDADRRREHVYLLQRLIDACDRHRPLGPDGKHGDRHTATCGCIDGQLEPAQPDTWAVDQATCVKCAWHSQNRPEPVDPASVRVGDIVEIEADGAVHSGPVLRASPSDFILGLPTTSHNGVAYWHDELRKEATVRILHAAEPEPDEAAVDALEIALTYSMGDESDEYLHSVAVDLARRNVRVVPDA